MKILYNYHDLMRLDNWKNKDVVIIGSGESRLKYIFNRKKFITFAVNKAIMDYPADYLCCVAMHLDEIMSKCRFTTPIVLLTKADGVENGLKAAHWGTAIFLMEIMARMSNRVLIQGFDLSQRRYLQQLPGFKRLQLWYPGKIFCTHQSQPYRLTFPIYTPGKEEVL
jgi:hypothetical protein